MEFHVLVVEDQLEISSVVTKYLAKEGYSFRVASNGIDALNYFNKEHFHLVLLDIMMPGIDGYDVLRTIRGTSDIPVIMVTAKQEEIDRLKGFDLGVDDYVIKPFSVKELIQRIKVIFKRVYGQLDSILNYENLSLDTKSMKLTLNHEEIIITQGEFQLLHVLMRHKGQVLTREQLIRLAYGDDYEGYDRNIDSYIKRIRQKIEVDPKQPEILQTKYGAGYIFGGAKK